MTDENKVETPTEEEELEELLIDDEESEDEESEELTPEKVKELETQNRRLKARLRKEAEKNKQPKPTEVEEEPVDDDIDRDFNRISILRDLSQDEYVELRRVSKDMGVEPEKLATSPLWRGHLTVFREEQKKSKSAIPPTGRTPRVSEKSFTNMTRDERRKHFSASREQSRNKFIGN